MDAYAVYIALVFLRQYAYSLLDDFDDFENIHDFVLLFLEYSEILCNRVWPVNMTDLIHNKIQDEIRYARAGQSCLLEM